MRGTLGASHNKDYTMLESISGSLHLWKPITIWGLRFRVHLDDLNALPGLSEESLHNNGVP